MIDTDKYEGCQTGRLISHKGLLCPTIFMVVDGSGKIFPTLDRGIVDVQADIPEHYLHLLQDAPLLLAEVKRLREAFITAVRHVGEHDLSRDDLFSKLDEDLFSLWLFRSE